MSAAAEGLRSRAAEFGLSREEFDMVVERMGREPNALEAAVFGALWSEHCGYKNSRPLLKRLPTSGPQVLQGPGENAGVIDIGDGYAVAFKMESHNHPSAVEPVQGAATGVGGILRDIFAMGARPIATLNALRFGEFDDERSRYLLAGVVHGIALYGNAIGVPTVGGEIETNPCYAENPLVNVMALGLMRHEELRKGTVGEVGNRLFYAGSRTGRDGLGGAVFASADLSESSQADRPAVQVGDPFMEKLLLEACLEAIRLDLVVGVQDMGAAGLSSSVGEMTHRAGLGVDLDLDAVPRREEGMTPLELMLSESQERMVLTARPGSEERLVELFERFDLDIVEVGVVREHGLLRILAGGKVVGEPPIAPLNEPPAYVREGVEEPSVALARSRDLSALPVPEDLGDALLTLLAAPQIASKLPIYRQFDHQVMTNTVVLPGQGDAAVLRVKGSSKGIAASVDCNSRYVYLDPELGAAHAVAEAARNVSCVGARPLAITDNLNFGNPTDPGVYYQLERAVAGLSRACSALGTPVTGGNVSLYNQFRQGDEQVAIHPTPTVGMVGVLDDVRRRATSGFKRVGDVVYLVGSEPGRLGASEYLYRLHALEAGSPPPLDLEQEAAVQAFVRERIAAGAVDTAHDVGVGGLAVTLAEMALADPALAEMALAEMALADPALAEMVLADPGLGEVPGSPPLGLRAEVPAGATGRPDEALFGESAARIVVAVPPESDAALVAAAEAEGVPLTRLGVVGGSALELAVAGAPDAALALPLAELASAHHATFRLALG